MISVAGDGRQMTPSSALIGVGVSPGRGAGPVVLIVPVAPPGSAGSAEPPELAERRIAAAGAEVRARLERAAATTSGPARDVLEASALMATDPSLHTAASSLVHDGVGAARAVWEAAARIVDDIRALGGPMAERATDIEDVRDRIVAVLQGVPGPGLPEQGHPFVLVAADLAPADIALLDAHQVRALVTVRGGPMSHAAILARTLGIPAVVGVRGATEIAPDTVVVVDGGAGTVTVDASRDELSDIRAPSPGRRLTGQGRTADGHHVPLMANVSRPEEAEAALRAGAEGIGLLRTEFCFLGRRRAPGRREQSQVYRRILETFAGRTVVIRTLDAGTDVALPFLPTTDEPNPALGVRGYRAFAADPGLLDVQLAAIADAAERCEADVWVMAPMITTAQDAEQLVARCAAHGLTTAGAMLEVPAAALLADRILASAAFASVGTNDLTQYAMAADRQAPELAHLCTPWQPAVLSLVATACRAGTADRPVGVCGEAAADPALAAVLVGLGAASLSMGSRALGDVATVLASVTLAECRDLAETALAAPSAEAARSQVRARLPVLADLNGATRAT
jgi:phosphotransferase system enzyme I (PtsI)